MNGIVFVLERVAFCIVTAAAVFLAFVFVIDRYDVKFERVRIGMDSALESRCFEADIPAPCVRFVSE